MSILPGFALVIIATHAQVEGMRWQMIPLYVFAIVALLMSLPDFMQSRRTASQRTRPLQILISLSLLAASMALPILLPVPSIPAPDGPYAVGTITFELTDPSRREIYSSGEEARRFQVQAWYPSEAGSSNRRAPWMRHADIFAPAIATYLHLPAYFLNHLALVKVPAYAESEVAASSTGYPLILFSHGWNGFNAQNTGQALQLASHGYIVIGVQHTYGAIITVFSDGTIAKNNPAALPDGAPDTEYELAAQKLVKQWADDLGYTLDFMEMQNSNPDSSFHKSLDLSRIGVYGHSTGGGAAIQFCGTDARCRAVLGMDPFMRPVSDGVLDQGVSQPAFFMFSQSWSDDAESRNNQLFTEFIPNVTRSFGVITIDGTAHYDFSDLPLLSPLAPTLGLKGPINGKYVTALVNDYLLSFFDATLNTVPTNLFDGQNHKYAEVRFRR